MGTLAPQITSLTIVYSTVSCIHLLPRFVRSGQYLQIEDVLASPSWLKSHWNESDPDGWIRVFIQSRNNGNFAMQ